MKFLVLFLSLIVIDKGCSQRNINQDLVSIEYAAFSRGYYKQITINKKEVLVTSQRGAEPKVMPCTEHDWQTLIADLKTVDIENISNLKAPSDRRLFDGAAIAQLNIAYKDTIYESTSFDHGNPPKEIEAVVKEIISISENIE